MQQSHKYYRSAYFYALKHIHAKDVYKTIEEERAIIEELGKKFNAAILNSGCDINIKFAVFFGSLDIQYGIIYE